MIQYSDTVAAVARRGINGLIYGRSGIGKTRLALTADRPMIAVSEPGLLSIRNRRLPIARIQSMADIDEFYHDMMEPGAKARFKTLIFDSVSALGEILLADNKAKYSDGRQAYGYLLDEILRMIRLFTEMDHYDVWMLAKLDFKDAGGVLRGGPVMPGVRAQFSLPYHFDEVFHYCEQMMPDGSTVAGFQTKLDPLFEAKDRSGALAPFEKPDLKYITAKIRTHKS